MVTSIYLIRHCEAEGNIKGIFQGHSDGDITQKGALQLECLKEKCRHIPFDAVYSSPLLRAVKTAKAVNHYHNAPFIIEKDLIEINGGDMEGHKWSELPVLFPEHFPAWKKDFATFAAPNGETVKDVYNRVKKSVLRIVDENRGKKIAIVSHGGALYTFISYINGYSAEEIGNLNFWADNASVTQVDFDSDKASLIYFNNTEHFKSSPDAIPEMVLW